MYKIFTNSLYDGRRFWRHSACFGRLERQEQLQSWIDGDCHKIEKALALPKPRTGSGQPVARRLIRNINDYLEKFVEDLSVHWAICGFKSYREFNERADVRPKSLFSDSGLERQIGIGCHHPAAVQEVSRVWIHRLGKIDFEAFFASRYCIACFPIYRFRWIGLKRQFC